MKKTDKVSIGERIKLVRGLTPQKDLAQNIGSHRNSISRYEAGLAFPSMDFMDAFCSYYNLNPQWFLTGEGEMYNAQPATPPSNVKEAGEAQSCYIDESGQINIPRWKNPDTEMFDYIPMVETQLSAGGGAFVISEEVQGYYAFLKTWLNRVATSTKSLVLMRVIGDSMSPTIQEGDTVMIDSGQRLIKEGMLYAIRFDSTVMIKRLAFRPGGRILIISDNRQEYESYEADMRDLHIIGQIIFFCRTLVPE